MGNHPGNRVNYAVLWDMDGVLVDTGEFHYQSWAETLSRLWHRFRSGDIPPLVRDE